jgi:hypothetical protein
MPVIRWSKRLQGCAKGAEMPVLLGGQTRVCRLAASSALTASCEPLRALLPSASCVSSRDGVGMICRLRCSGFCSSCLTVRSPIRPFL